MGRNRSIVKKVQALRSKLGPGIGTPSMVKKQFSKKTMFGPQRREDTAGNIKYLRKYFGGRKFTSDKIKQVEAGRKASAKGLKKVRAEPQTQSSKLNKLARKAMGK